MRSIESECFTIIINVFGEEGETNVSVNNISQVDVEVLDPMLIDIRNHRGYYPTKKFIRKGQPSARDLYGQYCAWDIFESLLPKTESGISNILRVRLFKDDPLEMDML